MVDVSHKSVTHRLAEAAGRVVLGKRAYQALQDQGLRKGDALAVARVAGIQAAKHTSTLIPLCHSIPLSSVSVDFAMDDSECAVRVNAKAVSTGPTGVEMEALTAVTVAALALYDMCKAVSKSIRIEDVHLVSKKGGKSGDYSHQSVPYTT